MYTSTKNKQRESFSDIGKPKYIVFCIYSAPGYETLAILAMDKSATPSLVSYMHVSGNLRMPPENVF